MIRIVERNLNSTILHREEQRSTSVARRDDGIYPAAAGW